jgi:hypothetical protein
VGGAAVIAALTWQQHNLTGLTEENSALRRQLAANSATLPPPATNNPAESETFARLREQQEELLRLRGEVAQLRRTARPSVATTQITPAASATSVDALATQMLLAQATSTKVINAMKNLGLAARIFATDNADRFPTTFEDMKNEMGLTPEGNLPGGIPAELFEFFPHERIISEVEPQMILFREKAARHLPDGTWERVYCLADGSVQRISRADGNFDEFEREGTGTPANAPKRP